MCLHAYVGMALHEPRCVWCKPHLHKKPQADVSETCHSGDQNYFSGYSVLHYSITKVDSGRCANRCWWAMMCQKV